MQCLLWNSLTDKNIHSGPRTCPFLVSLLVVTDSGFAGSEGGQASKQQENCPATTYFWVRGLLKSLLPWHQPHALPGFSYHPVAWNSQPCGTWHLFQSMLCFSPWIQDSILSMIPIWLKLWSCWKCFFSQFQVFPQPHRHCASHSFFLILIWALPDTLSQKKSNGFYNRHTHTAEPSTLKKACFMKLLRVKAIP